MADDRRGSGNHADESATLLPIFCPHKDGILETQCCMADNAGFLSARSIASVSPCREECHPMADDGRGLDRSANESTCLPIPVLQTDQASAGPHTAVIPSLASGQPMGEECHPMDSDGAMNGCADESALVAASACRRDKTFASPYTAAITPMATGQSCGEVSVRDPKTTRPTMARFTTYLISGHLRGRNPFSVRRRYSDFEWLRKMLSTNFPGIRVPPLPRKRVKDRFEKSFVESRRAGLEEFLRRCLLCPQLCLESQIFQRFVALQGVACESPMENLRNRFENRPLVEMSREYKLAYRSELQVLDAPIDDSKLHEAKVLLVFQIVRLQELVSALRDACEAQRSATTAAAAAQARFAAVCSSQTAATSEDDRPWVEIVAAWRQQQEVLQDAPASHYDVLLDAIEKELQESEAMQEALAELQKLKDKIAESKARAKFLKASRNRLVVRSCSSKPSALGRLFQHKDIETQLEDIDRELAKSKEDACVAEEWYVDARKVTVNKELVSFAAEKLALRKWLRDEIPCRSCATAQRLVSVWERLMDLN